MHLNNVCTLIINSNDLNNINKINYEYNIYIMNIYTFFEMIHNNINHVYNDALIILDECDQIFDIDKTNQVIVKSIYTVKEDINKIFKQYNTFYEKIINEKLNNFFLNFIEEINYG